MDKKKKKLIWIVIGIVAAVLAVTAVLLWMMFGRKEPEKAKKVPVNNLPVEEVDEMDKYVTIALFGVDNRSNGHLESGNSDSIMVCCVNTETKEIKLASVYRDTCFDVNGERKFRKCNYAYNHGGPQQAMAMLNRNLDLDIQNYVSVDFYSLAEIVDAVGGIELEITSQEARYMNGPDGYISETASITKRKSRDVSKGLQTVDGVQAVAYCRVRYTAGGDFKRSQRQREVLSKIAEKISSADAGTLLNVLTAVYDDIDTNLKMADIAALADGARDYHLGDTVGFPFAKKNSGGTSAGFLVVPCTLEDNVRELHQFLYPDAPYEPSSDLLKLSSDLVKHTGYDASDAEREE